MDRRRLCLALAATASLWLVGCTTMQKAQAPAESVSEPLPLAEPLAAAPEALVEPKPEPSPTTPPPPSPVVARALGAIGTRYRYGGNSLQSGFDCSGFVRWVYQDIAAQLPRSAQALSQVDAPLVEKDALQPGDLLFFRINRKRTVSHVGMYVGNGEFIHAPSSGGRVRVESMETPYWRARFVKARRWPIQPGAAPRPTTAAR